MKTLICIVLVWLAAALATAFIWHRLRRHEKYMESLLPKNESQYGGIKIPTSSNNIIKNCYFNDTDSATFMGMDKATELTKAQLDRLTGKER